ncbi:MAG: hypothetical protein JO021_01795 [Alphaproteobacteria bacterium]|nr:hypothetical protein [Alphaproteobacteria bacterium]
MANAFNLARSVDHRIAPVATANPERCIEDHSAFLRRVAKRCCRAAIALTAVAASVLLAA